MNYLRFLLLGGVSNRGKGLEYIHVTRMWRVYWKSLINIGHMWLDERYTSLQTWTSRRMTKDKIPMCKQLVSLAEVHWSIDPVSSHLFAEQPGIWHLGSIGFSRSCRGLFVPGSFGGHIEKTLTGNRKPFCSSKNGRLCRKPWFLPAN